MSDVGKGIQGRMSRRGRWMMFEVMGNVLDEIDVSMAEETVSFVRHN